MAVLISRTAARGNTRSSLRAGEGMLRVLQWRGNETQRLFPLLTMPRQSAVGVGGGCRWGAGSRQPRRRPVTLPLPRAAHSLHSLLCGTGTTLGREAVVCPRSGPVGAQGSRATGPPGRDLRRRGCVCRRVPVPARGGLEVEAWHQACGQLGPVSPVVPPERIQMVLEAEDPGTGDKAGHQLVPSEL